VKAVKEQFKEISEALTQVRVIRKISVIQSEAKSLLEYETIYKFILSIAI